jgi:hypothetical protein
VTLGEATPEHLYQQALPDWTIFPYGGLDHLSLQQIAALEQQPIKGHPVRGGDGTGREIVLDHAVYEHYLQQRINEVAAQGLTVSVILCTLDFPGIVLPANHLVIQPEGILAGLVKSLRFSGKLGVVVPLASQVTDSQNRWHVTTGRQVLSVPVESPIDQSRAEQAADALVAASCQVIVLDSTGFTSQVKQIIQQRTGLPVILASQAVVKGVQAILS